MTAAHRPDAVPLSRLETGRQGRLVRVDGGCDVRGRLSSMGLRCGTRFRVLQRREHGPCIVATEDGRVVIGRGLAHRLWVEPEPEAAPA
jgi:Fe2+ transport system protein FeoA